MSANCYGRYIRGLHYVSPRSFTPAMLVAAIAAILGGDSISSLVLMGERFENRDFHLCILWVLELAFSCMPFTYYWLLFFTTRVK